MYIRTVNGASWLTFRRFAVRVWAMGGSRGSDLPIHPTLVYTQMTYKGLHGHSVYVCWWKLALFGVTVIHWPAQEN